jgi:phosphonate transport system substrate-binding protein
LRAAETVKLAVTDLVGMEQLQVEFGKFVEVLEKNGDYKVEFYPVSNRLAASAALRRKQVDFVLTGPAEYVVIKKQTEAYPVVGFSRPDYFSTIAVMANSPYQSITDLKGQKVAVGDIGSTSNHLGPMQVMADFGLNPLADAEIINTKRAIAFEALKKGEIAAIGINRSHFERLRKKEYESGGMSPGSFRVIARGRDLPNDILLAGKHVDSKTVEKLRMVFTEHSNELIAAIITGPENAKYTGMAFLPKIEDKDYDYVRSMYATIGHPEHAEFVGN